ncbi:MAG: hypothetical protein EXR51_10480 [Dehalococcoidia bacterium]|nr:hypothetical protein [Dehalococcoidia bacterium]
MACLAVHVQVVLMILLASGSYLAYRTIAGPVTVPLVSLALPQRLLKRLWVAHTNVWRTILARFSALAAGAGLVAGLGLLTGAVQLLPLMELAQFSYRGMRVDYGFAATYAIPPLGLLQAVAPYLFKTAAGEWWTQQGNWETALYLGSPVLVLAAMGAGLARSRRGLFFLGLTIASLLLAMGPSAPFNLHRVLWELPGFSAMRAPARFTLLVVFGAATLAGLGCHWLDSRLSRSRLVLGPVSLRGIDRATAAVVFGIVSMVPLLLGLVAVTAGSWLDSHRAEALKALSTGEWGVRAASNAPLSLAAALDGLRWALAITNPALVAALLMAQLTVVLLGVWIVAPRLGHLCKGAILGLVVVDLLGFASAFHPLTSLGALSTPSGAVAFFIDQGNTERIFPKPHVLSMDANRLVPYGIPTFTGYSSLAPQRQMAYLHHLQTGYDTVPDTLLDTAGIRYLVREAKFPGLPFHNVVSIDPGGPLAQGSVNNAGSKTTFSGEDARGDTLAIISGLRHGVEIPQDAPVAEVTFVSASGERRTVTIRAGRDTAEWAFDRPDVVSKMKHRRPEVAMQLNQTDADNAKYKVNLYYAEIPVGAAVTARTIEYRYLYPAGALRLYGMTLLDRRSGAFTQIRNKTRYRLAYRDQEALVFENTAALPHAYVVRHAVAFPSSSGILEQMLEGNFDPRRSVILEGFDPGMGPLDVLVSENPAIAAPAGPGLIPARVEHYGPNEAVVAYTAADPGFLVFSDTYYPGWKAYLDGDPTPIYRANYLFRGVRVPSGTHRVEFKFEPESIRVGFWLTVLGLLTALLVLVVPESWVLFQRLACLADRVRRGLSLERWNVLHGRVMGLTHHDQP